MTRDPFYDHDTVSVDPCGLGFLATALVLGAAAVTGSLVAFALYAIFDRRKS